MLKVISGNLIELAKQGQFDVIVHGCNCFCSFGKGIAVTIKNEFPLAFEADLKTRKGDPNKLGTYSYAGVGSANNPLVVVNAYTQYHYTNEQVAAYRMKAGLPHSSALVEYGAIESVFEAIKRDFHGHRIGLPLIGAGLAHGDWAKIQATILRYLGEDDTTIVMWDGK